MFMTDTTTMDFQDAVIVHVTNVMMIYLVYQAVQIDIMLRAYEIIMGVIKDKTVEGDAVEYYKTARIADKNGHYMRRYIDYMTLRTSHDQAHHRQLLDLIV